MEYVPPIGGAEDAPFVNASPETGIPGSTVPAEALEHPMREIVHCIAAAGLTPDGEDLTQLEQAIAAMIAASVPTAAALPVGAEMTWQSATLPDPAVYGVWLEQDGSTFDAGLYPELSAHLGGSVLPNMRGEFARGWDHGRGVDPGRVMGSSQADDLRSHTHTYRVAAASGAYAMGNVSGSYGIEPSTGATGGSETRPRNIAKMYLIKAA